MAAVRDFCVVAHFVDDDRTRAGVSEIDLETLVAQSDAIVVAVVKDVRKMPISVQHPDVEFPPIELATAKVVETWKGAAVSEVRFLASPTRMCDISSAAKGETVVLFLQGQRTSEIMRISHFGRGKMDLSEFEGKQSADLDRKILLPPKTKTSTRYVSVTIQIPLAFLDPKASGTEPVQLMSPVRSIELSELRSLVKKSIRSRLSRADLSQL